MAKNYKSTFTEAQLLNTDPAVVAGAPVLIGEYSVQAGEIVGLGYGNGGQNSALGRIYAKFQNATPTQLHGTVRIQIASPQDIPLAVVYEARTEDLASGGDDITKRLPFNESELDAKVTEDKKIQIWFISDTSDTLKTSNCDIIMSISRNLI